MPRSHPMQPVEWASDGVIRFKENKIIDYLFKTGKLDLNEIAAIPFPPEDRMQLAQLLGYSVSGYGDLSYVTPENLAEAEELRDELRKRKT